MVQPASHTSLRKKDGDEIRPVIRQGFLHSPGLLLPVPCFQKMVSSCFHLVSELSCVSVSVPSRGSDSRCHLSCRGHSARRTRCLPSPELVPKPEAREPDLHPTLCLQSFETHCARGRQEPDISVGFFQPLPRAEQGAGHPKGSPAASTSAPRVFRRLRNRSLWSFFPPPLDVALFQLSCHRRLEFAISAYFPAHSLNFCVLIQ
ncbi:uncharacterized protein AAES06_013343 [Glossophaga mutica]